MVQMEANKYLDTHVNNPSFILVSQVHERDYSMLQKDVRCPYSNFESKRAILIRQCITKLSGSAMGFKKNDACL